MNNKKQPLEFRAWQPFNSLHRSAGMYMVQDLVFYDGEGGGGEAFLNKYGEKAKSSELLSEIYLMQFTNFKDARNKKVFAGDIVSPISDPEHERRCWEVKHEFGCFWINDAPIFDYAKFEMKGEERLRYPTYQLEDLEVVDTIYTGKELLG